MLEQTTKLRKAGRLSEAYAIAKRLLMQSPDAPWARRSMAWVLNDYAKANAVFDKQQQFLECLHQLSCLSVPFDEPLFWEKIAWTIRGMVSTVERRKGHRTEFFDALFKEMQSLYFVRPGESYSALFRTFLKLKLTWKGFPEFCRWWQFRYFRPEDYLPTKTSDGRPVRPLAERGFMAYSKCMMLQHDEALLSEWIPRLTRIRKQYPAYTYIPFYEIRLQILAGKRKEACAMLLAYANQKQHDFWVWELLGDAYEDEERRFCMYAKALTCKARPEMLLGLREKMVAALLQRDCFSEAKRELELLLQTRRENGWAVSGKLCGMEQADWFQFTQSDENVQEFYAPFARLAEQLVLGQVMDSIRFAGPLKKCASGIGFVGEVYLPARMVANLEDGAEVIGKAVKSFDTKRERWGWRALQVNLTKKQKDDVI